MLSQYVIRTLLARRSEIKATLATNTQFAERLNYERYITRGEVYPLRQIIIRAGHNPVPNTSPTQHNMPSSVIEDLRSLDILTGSLQRLEDRAMIVERMIKSGKHWGETIEEEPRRNSVEING